MQFIKIALLTLYNSETEDKLFAKFPTGTTSNYPTKSNIQRFTFDFIETDYTGQIVDGV